MQRQTLLVNSNSLLRFKLNWHEKGTQLTLFLAIYRMKPWTVLYLYTGMLDCISFTNDQSFCDLYTTSGQFTAAGRKYTCGSYGLTTWRFDTKMCVYMCLVDLLNGNHTKHGWMAIHPMPKLNLEQRNHSLSIFVAVFFTNVGRWTLQCIQINNI